MGSMVKVYELMKDGAKKERHNVCGVEGLGAFSCCWPKEGSYGFGGGLPGCMQRGLVLSREGSFGKASDGEGVAKAIEDDI